MRSLLSALGLARPDPALTRAVASLPLGRGLHRARWRGRLIGNWRAAGGGHDQAGRRTYASCRLDACATRAGGDPAPCRGRHPARVNLASSL